MKLHELPPNEANPRTITDDECSRLQRSIDTFGDLSGLVYNRRTSTIVGGNQRSTLFDDAKITRTKEYETPTIQGTTAEGYIDLDGERFSFREVDWDEETERTACVAANKHGGSFDWKKVEDLFSDVESKDDLTNLGFDDRELDKIIKAAGKKEISPEKSLFLTVTTTQKEEIDARISILSERFSTEGVAATIFEAIKNDFVWKFET